MALVVSLLAPDDTSARFDRTVAAFREIRAEVDPDMTPDNEASFRDRIQTSPTFEKPVLIAESGNEVVGLCRMWMFHIEGNTEKAEALIEVRPAHRRLGVGTALLEATLDICDENGRTNLTGAGVTSEPVTAFWEAAGMRLGLVERESRLWMADTDPELMQRWIDARTDRAGDYRLVHFRGHTPPAHLEAMATMMTAMNDAPTDDLDINPDIWTERDVAELDDYLVTGGVDRWCSLILDPHGDPAAMTVVMLRTSLPRFAAQGDTVVLATHRERGLGRWIKADMWQRLRADAPELEAIDTDNAQSNAPMLAINVAMGFAPLHETGYWQADVADVRRALAAR